MFEAFILAGGKSARMNREKSLVEVKGKRLAESAVETVISADCNEVTILAGSKRESLTEHFPKFVIENDFSPGMGASGGIFTALSNTKSDEVFVLACDLPFVTKELIGYLYKRFRASGADATVPLQADKFKQPLCAFYRKSACIVPFQAQILRSELSPSVRDLLSLVNTEFVDFEDIAHLKGSEDFFLNVNTPLDLESAREIARRK